MVPERYSVARTVQDTQIGAESVQEDSRLESDGLQSAKSAALNPSHWMTQGLLDGPDKKASHASTPQGPVATFNESGRETNDQRVRDAHQVDTSDYNGRPLRRSQLAPGSPIRAQQYNARSSKYASSLSSPPWHQAFFRIVWLC
ncbi:hypothetical protein M407DRAFT_25430 [Tulasnella calospora MUT 4182]|uniref:Uncharacterized protein n=1 Tax=Tulasnella calospora MUT 4182 TaxID=1051891 RepID=A0A0C3QG32_9AGAM|nr:hypothetical protein M407DRAFT_25430 [Tulasnella calospora MUT 4182]